MKSQIYLELMCFNIQYLMIRKVRPQMTSG